MMFCGAASFSHINDENDPATPPAPPPRPRGWKKKQSSSNKNPYSSRGLDKFSEVMSELEAKREKIMATAAGSDGVKMVRFMYTNSEDWIPIVVRLRNDPPPKEVRARKSTEKAQPVLPLLQQPEESSSDSEAVKVTEAASVMPVKELKRKNTFSLADEEFLRGWRPSYYWLVVMMVILVCLMMFGRVFAICCTSVWWYLAPTFMATGENDDGNQRLIKKKDYPKIVSNNRPLTQPKNMLELNGRM